MAQPRQEPAHRYDVCARLAGRHLRTSAERAVFLTLVSQVAQSWSAAELAQVKRLDERETERIFEEYAAAGIAERTDAAESRRYRWRSDMG